MNNGNCKENASFEISADGGTIYAGIRTSAEQTLAPVKVNKTSVRVSVW